MPFVGSDAGADPEGNKELEDLQRELERVLGEEADSKDQAAVAFEQMAAGVQALLDSMATVQSSLAAKTEQHEDLMTTLEV